VYIIVGVVELLVLDQPYLRIMTVTLKGEAWAWIEFDRQTNKLLSTHWWPLAVHLCPAQRWIHGMRILS